MALAAWQGHYADEPTGKGLAALGLSGGESADGDPDPVMRADGKVEPLFEALTPQQRLQAANQWRIGRQQKQAAAQADLHETLQRQMPQLMLSGSWSGIPPGREPFVAAHGPEDGARRYQAFTQAVQDAPLISTTLHLPDAQQDAALGHYASAADAEGKRLYASLATAVDRLRTDRAADPVGTLGQLYPALGQGWQDLATADPATLRQKLPGLIGQTAALMDKTGMPLGQRQYLPKNIASRAVTTFHDETRPLGDRIASLSTLSAATPNPWLQIKIFADLAKAGMPPMMQAVAMAFARGDAGAANRIAEAISAASNRAGTSLPDTSRHLGAADQEIDPEQDERIQAPEDTGGTATPAYPSVGRRMHSPAIPQADGTPASDGSPVLNGEEKSLLVNIDRIRQLHEQMTRYNSARNGGDQQAASATADADLFGSVSGPAQAEAKDISGASATILDKARRDWAGDKSFDQIRRAYQDAQNDGDEAAQKTFMQIYIEKERQEYPWSMGVNDRVRSFARGVPILGGLADEANAFTTAPYSATFGDGKAYSEALDYQRSRDSFFDQNSPWTSNSLQFAGGVAAGVGILKYIGPAFRSVSLLKSMLAGAATGAATGGVDGFTRGEGDSQNRLENGGAGALIGGIAGGLGPVIDKGISRAVDWGANKYVQFAGRQANKLATVVNEAGEFIGPVSGLRFKVSRSGTIEKGEYAGRSEVEIYAPTENGKKAYVEANLTVNGDLHLEYNYNGGVSGAGQDAISAAISHFGKDRIKSLSGRFAHKNLDKINEVLTYYHTDLEHANAKQISAAIGNTPTYNAIANLGYGNYSFVVKKIGESHVLDVTFTK